MNHGNFNPRTGWRASARVFGHRVGFRAEVALVVAALLAAVTLPALAQVVGAPPPAPRSSVIDVGSWYQSWRPVIMDLLTIFVSLVVIPVLGVYLKKKYDIDLDAKHRETIQTAALNAAGLLVANGGVLLQGKTIDVKSPLLAEALEYMRKNAGDAIDHFKLKDRADELAQKIIAKIPQVTPPPSTGIVESS